MFLNMKGTIIQNRIYRDFSAVQADIVKTPDVPIPPSIQLPKVETNIQILKRMSKPAEKGKRGLSKKLPQTFSSSRLPQRALVTKLPDQFMPNAEIPMINTDLPMQSSLPNPTSSANSATGATIGRGGESTSVSGRGGGGKGGLASLTQEIARSDPSLSEKFQNISQADIPFITALRNIAEHVSNTSKTRKVDIVFIVDTSASMQDNINSVRKHLNRMIDTFQKGNLDFTLGIVRFHHSTVFEWLGMDVVISKQTTDVEEIKSILKSIKVSGNERALDALMRAINEVKFRPDAERHFILITDEYVRGTHPVSEILKAAKRKNIVIDILGRDEPFQRTIAEQTGGIWVSIEQLK